MVKRELLKDLRSKSIDELRKEKLSLKDKLRELNFDLSIKRIKNYKEIGSLKKKIACVMTIIREKELEQLGASDEGTN